MSGILYVLRVFLAKATVCLVCGYFCFFFVNFVSVVFSLDVNSCAVDRLERLTVTGSLSPQLL